VLLPVVVRIDVVEGEKAMTPPPPEELPLLEHPMATAAKAAASGATAFVLRFIMSC